MFIVKYIKDVFGAVKSLLVGHAADRLLFYAS